MIDLPPDVPPQYAPVIIAQATQTQQGDTKTDRTIGVCQLIENPPIPPTTAVNSFTPLGSASVYLEKQEHRKLDWSSRKVTVLQGPEHGELEGDERGTFGYFPTDPNYRGPDRATFLVQIGDLKVKVLYFFKVQFGGFGGTEGYDPYLDKKNCPQGRLWKISLNTN